MRYFSITIMLVLINCASSGASQRSMFEGSPVMKSSAFSGKSTPKESMQRILVYTGSITVKVEKKEFEPVINNIIQYVKDNKGYVSNQSLNSLVIRIPSDIFKPTFKEIKKLGEVDSERVYIKDISKKYYDTKIRLENSLKLQKRLTELLTKTKDVGETVQVERELSRVTETIETLRGAMKLYDNQKEFSTISIYLKEKMKPGILSYPFIYLYKGLSWLFIRN